MCSSDLCLKEAREQGRGFTALLIDWAGMQMGMLLGHLPLLFLPVFDRRAAWLFHGVMLLGMLLGMLAAAGVQAPRLSAGAPIKRTFA